ncbi:tetratricopeptide repeat protein [Reichenbachiella sp. MALMAid0571]|uniref:tetratricopeptide repeat-containing sensor histidine kinase n=1 Tax=Reichenbachiella sp. MALMAid0571 TaxID=3143939 RepID=UPI0032E01963
MSTQPKTSPKIVLTFFILCLNLFTYGQNQELDSIKTLVETYKKDDTIRVNLLIDFTKYYTSRDINQNLPLIEEAMQISEKIGYKRGSGISLNALSTYYTLKGELDKALENALQAKELLQTINDHNNLIVTNNNLARIYGANKKHNKALEIHLQNVELIKNRPTSPSKAGYYFYVAKTYQELLKLKEAEEYYKTALKISEKADYSTGVAIAQGSLGNLYNILGNYTEAIKFIKLALDFSIKHGQTSNVAASYFTLADSYSRLNNLNAAIENNSKAIEIYESLNNFRMLKEAYIGQYQYFEKLKQYENANKFLKLHYNMVDTLFSENKVKIIEDLQTKYETEKKEAQILSLSQQASIQALEIKQKNQAIVIGLIVVLFFGTALYFIYQQRTLKKERAQSELEQRFLRSQLNPHFIFNALLAIQNFMIKNNAQSAALYLTKFSKLMRQILESSREEFIAVESEIEMLTNYMDIHKLRLKDTFEYKIDVDKNIDVETDTIPPMFVQPFVENAIEHGIINAKDQGLVEIRFYKEKEYISIEIKDNGGGLVRENATPSEHQPLASTIIRERMALFNKNLKDKIQLILNDIENEKGEIMGTKVELKVPFSYV